MRDLVLLVEDNPDDELITLRALRKETAVGRVEIVRDGAAALDFLFGAGAHASRDVHDQPQLVLMDLKLPKINGLEVLERIRRDERTRRIPVVILTASTQESDKKAGYNLGANSFVSKPVEAGEYAHAVRGVGSYWLGINQVSSE